MSILEQEKRELAEAVRLDAHGIEPVPVADRDSTPLQQFWVWMGANLVTASFKSSIGIGFSITKSIPLNFGAGDRNRSAYAVSNTTG